ncbi:hypothetical protein LCGC14_1284770 [marine sediment metagenome]|uniref:Uncharacterized protein n=1 Tax=marine sediment metagenome TaxID=412755 RepID=A0A0F9NAV9_9ZZZZ
MAKKKLNKEQQRLLELAGMGYSRRGYEHEEDMGHDEDMAGDDMNGDINGDEREQEEPSLLDDVLSKARDFEAEQLLDLVEKLGHYVGEEDLQMVLDGMEESSEDDMNGDMNGGMNGNGGDETSRAYQRMQRDEKY